MENAADALQMAAAVLIFVLALTIAINSFGQVRQVSQLILDYNDREYSYDYVEQSSTTERVVGVESIIPSVYKAYRENYKILFEGTDYLYETREDGKWGKYAYNIDLEDGVTLGLDWQKLLFIMIVLYGDKVDFSEYNDHFPTTGASWDTVYDYFESLGIRLKKDGLYDKIKGETFIEKIGLYYQEEADNPDNTDVPEANLTEKRVITYTLY